MRLALKLVPKGMQQRAQPLVRRAETFVREWEWTWTKAVIVALALWFAGILFLAFIPSWWLYFADQTLGLRETGCLGGGHSETTCFWMFKLRDLVAIIAFSIPFGGFIMVPYSLQKWRRRLRGESEARPAGGYR